MTRKELKHFFKEHLVPSKLYKIGGKHNKRICLEKDKKTGNWVVFFSDKEDKVGLTSYNDEASACAGMKEEICKLMKLMYGVSFTA